MSIEKLVTTSEAATMLRISPAAIRRLVALGCLPAIRPTGGRVFRFTPEDLTAHIERFRVRPVENSEAAG